MHSNSDLPPPNFQFLSASEPGTSSIGFWKEAKDQRAARSRRRLRMVLCCLTPIGVGGASGSLLFDGPIPDWLTCLKAIGIAVAATYFIVGVIFCFVMAKALRFIPTDTDFMSGTPLGAERHEPFDPLYLATTLAAIGGVAAMSLVGPGARMLAAPKKWEPQGVIAPLIGAVIGTILGGTLAVWISARAKQVATDHSSGPEHRA